jgi:replicative DNA helicase
LHFSQLSRKVEKKERRQTKIPQLRDLRTVIEQDADMVMFYGRPVIFIMM